MRDDRRKRGEGAEPCGILVLSILCLVLVSVALGARADGDFQYEITDGKATITAYTGGDASVSIPASLDGYPVTAIGANAFDGCGSLSEVILPGTVTRIEWGAFRSCGSLTGIVLPAGLTYIGKARLNTAGVCRK